MNSRFILVLLSLLTIFTTISYAQIQPATPKKFVDGLKSLTCGTQPVSYEDELEMQRLIANLTNQKLVTRSSTTYLAIKPHLIRRDDGSGALDLSQLNDALAELNRQFAAMNVQFYFCGTSPNYINNTGAYDWTFTSADRDVMTNANNVNNAHNVYFSGSLGGVGGFSFGATQNRVNNRTFVLNGQANDDKTLTHEIGHYFNLSHTFRNSAHATIARRELVTRISPETGARLAANCSTEGDFICDTPADPYELTGGDLSSNCVYTGTVTDANGDAFMPSMTNIMNYYFCDPYDFTAGQYARMTAALAVNNTPSSNPSTNYTLDCPETVQSAPSSVTATLVSTSVNLGVTLTWSHASSVETGYIIERSTSPTSGFIPIGGVEPDVFTFKDASATSGTTYYYRIKPSNTKDNYGSNGTVTTPITCGATYSSPCTVGGTTAAHIINNFIIKTTSNTILIDNSNSGCSANSYGDYTGLSASVSAGTTYNFTMNTFYGSNGYFPQHIGIFIDINNDGDFSDVGEQVYQSTGTVMSGTTLITGSFTVPSTAINGSTRLRIRSRNNSEIVTSACGSFSSGETEDYTLIISGGACTPPTVSITGATSICVGLTTTLSPTTGGTWASSNTAVATVTNAGVVSGVSGGTATFTFTQTSTGCINTTPSVSVNALPSVSITGSNPICVGATTTLSPITGGTWASSNTAVATVTNAGVVTGVSGGTATFTFTQTSTGCINTTPSVSVNALPSVSITGSNPICVGASTALSPITGGTWTSSNTAVATVTNAGVVSGVSGGTATFTFTQTSTGCIICNRADWRCAP